MTVSVLLLPEDDFIRLHEAGPAAGHVFRIFVALRVFFVVFEFFALLLLLFHLLLQGRFLGSQRLFLAVEADDLNQEKYRSRDPNRMNNQLISIAE